MILEHLYQGEPGAWKIVFRASAEELARALAALEAEAGPAPDGGEEDRLAEAVNRAILAPDGFSTVWAEAVEKAGLQPVSDPDFKLTALNKAEGFRAEAVFFALPPLTLGQYTGFVQSIEPRPIRRLAIELEINQHHGAEERAADAAGKAQLRQQVIAGLYARRCEQARQLAQARLILCLGDQVTGPLPRQLMAEHYLRPFVSNGAETNARASSQLEGPLYDALANLSRRAQVRVKLGNEGDEDREEGKGNAEKMFTWSWLDKLVDQLALGPPFNSRGTQHEFDSDSDEGSDRCVEGWSPSNPTFGSSAGVMGSSITPPRAKKIISISTSSRFSCTSTTLPLAVIMETPAEP